MKGNHRSGRLGVAQVGQHQAVAVDDTRTGGQQSPDAGHRRFQVAHLLRRFPDEIRHAVRRGFLLQLGKRRHLGGVRRDDQLAAARMSDAVRLAITIERELAGDAGPCLQTSGRVVDAGMDDFGIARGGLAADLAGPLQHQYIAASQRQRAGHCKTDHAGPDHDGIDAFGRAHLTLKSKGAASSQRKLPSSCRINSGK